tara:strand:- start:11664 stop:11846 length:183 start_codon:yes stop_codon:yes gene_type:complete
MSRTTINALAVGVLACSAAFLFCLWLFPDEAGSGWFKDRIIAVLITLLGLTLATASRRVK